MAYKGKVISGDCHIDIPWLPADLFTSKSPAHLRDRMPRVVETSDGKQWFTEDSLLGWVAGAGLGLRPGGWDPYVPGASRRLDTMEERASFYSDGLKGLMHPTTPELRIKDQDTDGVSGEVIYGVLGLAGGLGFDDPDEIGMGGGDSPGAGYGISDPEVSTAAYDVYNDWLGDFCKTNPDRFVGLACLSGHDPQKAASQLRHAAEIGLRGAELNVSAVEEPIYHDNWDVLWAAADECNMSISFHTTGLSPRVPKKSDREKYQMTYNAINLTQFQLSGAEFLSSISFSGACARFPNFKFVLGECGIGWIPYILHRMDEEYEKQFFHLELGSNPSEFWRRQGVSTFQHEFVTNEMVDLIGEDNIIWGSDYPHPDGIWPDSRKVIDENLGHLEESKLRKIVCDNTANLYGFPN